MTSSRAWRRENEGPGRGPWVPVTLAALTTSFAFPLTACPSFPRKMFSSVAHLARANPFNAPHLQLVYDGLAGPSSSPAGPPGPPRRSRSLAAAAVEGEVRPTLPRYGHYAHSWAARPCRPARGLEDREGRAQRPAPRDGARLLAGGCQPPLPRPGVGSLALPRGRGSRHRSLRDLHDLKG